MKLTHLAGTVALAAACLVGLPVSTASAAAPIAHARFSGVSCVAANFCVAVGAVTSDTRIDNVIEMWNGHRWQRRKAPIPAGGRYGALAAVSCTSRHFCLAVGDWTGTNENGSLGEVWNGTKWTFVKAPSTGQFGESLYGVSCLSRTSCVAVGERFHAESSTVLAESFNGTKWTILRATKPHSVEANLTSVSCAAANRCVAVGSYLDKAVGTRPLGEAWDGSTWTLTSLPNPDHSQHAQGGSASGLSDVSCTAARKCVAVGTVGNDTRSKPLIERWDGAHWKRLAAATTGTANGHFSSVACVSARRCRAVGSSTAASGATSTLVQVWTGGAWTTEHSVNPASYSNFSEISCLSTKNCIAVGSSDANAEGQSNTHTLAERWDGTAWQVLATR